MRALLFTSLAALPACGGTDADPAAACLTYHQSLVDCWAEAGLEYAGSEDDTCAPLTVSDDASNDELEAAEAQLLCWAAAFDDADCEIDVQSGLLRTGGLDLYPCPDDPFPAP